MFYDISKLFMTDCKLLLTSRHSELKFNFSINWEKQDDSAISSSLCIEIPIYRLYCFVGYFARPQIYALSSEPYALYSDSLFHKRTAQKQ